MAEEQKQPQIDPEEPDAEVELIDNDSRSERENGSTQASTDSDGQSNESSVKGHLLFHKALISDDDEDEGKLDKYMSIVEQLEHGMEIAFPNPFDRAIAITFQLAIEHQLNPWDIDLLRFSTEYLKHVKKDKNLDLVTAGRIILMAWKILKLQSEEVLENAQQIQEQEEEFWNEPDGDWYLNDDDFEYTSEVISQEEPPIHEMIWRKGKRRVSLLELIGAFEEAKHEAKLIQILNDRREEEREKLKIYRRQNINEKVHQESLQDEMELVYDRICRFNGHPIPLSDIYEEDLEDKITTLVSSLFLALDRKINIWQRKFPYGEIMVKNLHQDHAELPENFTGRENIDELNLNELAFDDENENDHGDNGDPDKVLINDLDLDQTKSKKKKKKKGEIEELITSQINIAS
jgi:segregation and condensation protein A